MFPAQANIFSGYFDSNVALLKLTAFWLYDDPNTEPVKRYGLLAYNIFCSFYVYFCYLPAEILYVFWSFHDLDKFVRSLRDIGNHIALVYKASNYFFVRKDLLNLIEILENIPCDYEEYQDFNPEEIVKQHKKEALKWTSYFWYFVNTICITMFTSGLLIFIFNGDSQYEIENERSVYRQKQPVNTVSPFGNETRTQFFITFIYTMIALVFFAWMIVALDSLFITLMSCISAHLHILQGAFKTLRPRCLERLKFFPQVGVLHDAPNVQEEIEEEMMKCIRHLQTILRVSAKLEAVYNGQTFFQTFISLGEMCFSLYLLSNTLDENTGNEITYLLATGFELLMYCWFGNRITETSMAVSYALYEGDWLPTSLTFRKQMIFTFTRMKRPIYVTIGKITPLTFTTFLTMVRGAYSFFTFLKQRDGISHRT